MKSETTFLTKVKNFLFTPQFSIRNVILSIGLGFIVAYLTILSIYGIDGANHILKSLFVQDFLNSKTSARLMSKFAILGLAGLAVAFGMKAGILNIGVSGQMTAGGFLGYFIISKWHWAMDSGNQGVVLLLAFFIVVVTAMMMAMISGVFKAFFRVNEVISTIMLNWVAVYLVKRYANTDKKDAMNAPIGDGKKGNDILFVDGHEWVFAIVGLLLLVSLAVFAWIFLTKTRGGFKLIAVGQNKDAADYSGYNSKFLTLITFAISGFFAGVAGFVSFFLSYNSIPAMEAPIGDGFTGIAVALVAMVNPLGVIPAAFLFAVLNGPVDGLVVAGYAPDIVLIFSGVITYFVAITSLFMYLRPVKMVQDWKNKRNAKVAATERGDF